jgi:uncharacterized protein
MESATPVVQAAEAIEGLRLALATGGVTGSYACDAGGAVMLGCPRAAGAAAGDLVIWCDGAWFWWRTGMIRNGRPVLTIHSAADPEGAARRVREHRRGGTGGGLNGTPLDQPAVLTPGAATVTGEGPGMTGSAASAGGPASAAWRNGTVHRAASPAAERIEQELAATALIDHHAHLPLIRELPGDRTGPFEAYLTESDRPPAPGLTQFDSQLGVAVRRWCAPVLDLEPFPTAADYLARRAELGAAEATRRFLRASGTASYLIDTGYGGSPGPPSPPATEPVTEPATEPAVGLAAMHDLSGARVHEVVRLETVAERLARDSISAAEFPDRFGAMLEDETRHAAAVKSVIAYRYGLDFDPAPPSHREVVTAAGAWLREVERGGRPRVNDPVLLRHLLWAGVERGLPVQVHTGFGDPDLELHRCDPALMTGFLSRVEQHGVPVMLLHCYPYHRSAGYLAQAFPHVFCDVGLAVNHTGARAAAVIAECLELAPFGKVLYSSDACGPAELHFLGALLWRRAVGRVLGTWVDDGDWDTADAVRVASMIGRGNASRVYRLDRLD